MISAPSPVVLTLALVAGVSAAGVDLAAASQESRTASPGRVAAHAGVFVPSLGGADYVVTLRVQRGWGPRGSDTHIVVRHGDWVRIDVVRDRRATTRYLGLAHRVEASLSRDPAGGYSYVGIKTGPDPSPSGMDYRSFRTGEADVVLGERCEVWDVYRSRPDERGPGGFARLGCSRTTASSSGNGRWGTMATFCHPRKPRAWSGDRSMPGKSVRRTTC